MILSFVLFCYGFGYAYPGTIIHVNVYRDSYGFALRPQYAQRYREYSSIYKEEEGERSYKWRSFLGEAPNSAKPSSPENKHKETSEVECNEVKEESSSNKVCKEDDLNSKNISEGTKEVGVGGVSEGGDLSGRKSSGVNEIKEGTSAGRVCEGGDSSGRKVVFDISIENSSEKDLHYSEERKTRKVQRWAEIRPSLSAIEKLMSSRFKKGNDVKGEIRNGNNDHLPYIEKSKLGGGVSATDVNKSSAALVVEDSLQQFSLWKELEFLVQGGIPKDLRGEVWQAFVGVKTRRVKSYYEDLLAKETINAESNEQNDTSTASGKWRKQIEKDITRTFPGHPALDEHGRNSLRRLLLAYARHNPSVGYCQAMNFFAGLLLLLMPEENAFWTFVGIIDDYFGGCYTEEMIESQVDQLVFEELMRERFPKLVNHLEYLGVQVTWISGPWFLSIFVNMIPWESVLRVWDVLLFEGNRVMLFRTALALMELYGPALVTTKDAGDAITLLQSLAGSTFDSSQLVLTACMGFLAVTEEKLHELREKHRPSVLEVVEERARKGRLWKDSKGIASKLYSFKHDQEPLVEEKKVNKGDDMAANEEIPRIESHSSDLDELLHSLNVDSEVDSLPDLQEQVVWLKVELCRLLEEKRNAILRAEELETALMDMVKQDNRLQLSARIEELEQEVAELQQVLADKKEQEVAMMQVLVKLEHDQKDTEDARKRAEQELAAQKLEVHILQKVCWRLPFNMNLAKTKHFLHQGLVVVKVHIQIATHVLVYFLDVVGLIKTRGSLMLRNPVKICLPMPLWGLNPMTKKSKHSTCRAAMFES
ncbi:TBC1 domain family member 8B-like isoform X2 [Arachis ipaensis]|uniref:TBC1 domain family member 8B-like isoform X2 n=1 Tax=Arachis ipaensis TaxID=130454 RepID=UPI000A2B9761|nr:TBC1 domain family member 8B-like isoform X2 [Arachis ipaensis]